MGGMKIMKKLFTALFITLMLATIVIAQELSVGSVDSECIANGFDYGIAKYQCSETAAEEGSHYDDYTIGVTWTQDNSDCTSVDWTASPAVDGVLSKEGTNTTVTSGGTSGTIDQIGDNSISHITFCGDEEFEIPEFTTIGAGLALLGAGVYIWKKRK
jgi:hypothetical protein